MIIKMTNNIVPYATTNNIFDCPVILIRINLIPEEALVWQITDYDFPTLLETLYIHTFAFYAIYN